ncbi:MAG: LLM class flavin-dependent oxidoreductase [Chloroflexi bacterium]|nr:LLM class flavin-dependent oxidoreductase [Chloroflexota bacterium]
MIPIALQIIPHVGVRALVRVAAEAERLGYDTLWLSDEGFMVDPFTVLGLIADKTSRIRLGVVTNPYTRHPAMTAAALATLHQMSGERAALCYVAGGSLVLDPIGLSRPQPVQTVQEAITLTRHLLGGEKVTWQGTVFQLKEAQLMVRVDSIPPLHVAARGAKMLEMAARHADAVWTGTDEATIQAVRAAADGRPLKLICGEHPPTAAEAASALSKAVQQDGGAGEVAASEDFAAWTARVRQQTSRMDSLLIVTWEDNPDALLAMLGSVKEALA